MTMSDVRLTWSHGSVLGSREHGGRTPKQNCEGQPNLPNDFLLHESASHSKFQMTTRDPGRHRQMPNFALSAAARVRISLGLPAFAGASLAEASLSRTM